MSEQVYSVENFVKYLTRKLDSDPFVHNVLIEGEISNFTMYRGSHWYFDLKDQKSQIACVMFSGQNSKLLFTPKEGDKVVVEASASIYAPRGKLQLIISNMKPSGVGELYLQFEALKEKLSNLGLFNPEHKKPIPAYPFKIGLVTGAKTAARSDVITTLERRWPVATIYECNALVQGSDSAPQVIDALNTLDQLSLDVIILARGGGSIEDLFSFNDERLAYTIYNLKTPIVTGVGHEVDFTIADFVADLRAPTPTGAAEMVSPDMFKLKVDLRNKNDRILNAIRAFYTTRLTLLRKAVSSKVFQQPESLITQKNLKLVYLQNDLSHQISLRSTNQENKLHSLNSKLITLTNSKINHEKVRTASYNKILLANTVNVRIINEHNKLINYRKNLIGNIVNPKLGREKVKLDNLNKLLLANSAENKINEQRNRLDHLKKQLVANTLNSKIEKDRIQLDNLEKLLYNNAQRKLELYNKQLSNYLQLLDAYSPLKVLQRGYSVVWHDKKIVSDASLINKGDLLEIKLDKGKIEAEVKNINLGGKEHD